MHFKFNKKIQNFIDIITETAKKYDTRIFFVGGMVRDNLLNYPIIKSWISPINGFGQDNM